MGKLFRILFLFLIIFIVLFYVARSYRASLLATIISHKTNTPISIEEVNFHKTGITIERFQMGNPKGTRFPTALSVDTIEVKAPYKNYLKDPIYIDTIHLKDVYVNIQIDNRAQTEGNWQTIIADMNKDKKTFFSIEKKTVIRKLFLTNVKIVIILSDGKLHELSPIEILQFDNVSTEKGIPIHEISEIIVAKMMHSIFIQQGIKNILNVPFNIIKGIFPFLSPSGGN